MELLRSLHAGGKSVVTVRHDRNRAARCADRLVVMRAGWFFNTGAPAEIITAELIESVFGLPAIIIADPVTGTPMVIARDPQRAPLHPTEPQENPE